MEEARGRDVTIRFEGKKCIHSRGCVLGRPDVFVPNVEGEWIHPDAASAEAVMALAANCPSGAIEAVRHAGEQEQAPKVNLVRVRENGPLALLGELVLRGEKIGFRATLCRCGNSANKPYCDGSHTRIGFTATGEAASQTSTALEVRDGPLSIEPRPNASLLVTGNLEVVSGTGRTINRMKKAFFCRCGQSSNKPFCDATHAKVGFVAD
jgi:CDGSH-type Zn-finger protein/uncharacterized Fe-S cluster protein YjdI